MTLHVKAGKVRLHLWLPLSVLKGRFAYKVAKRAIEDAQKRRDDEAEPQAELENPAVAQNEQLENTENKQDKSVSLTREQFLQIYKTLKQFVKLNGHFDLVEVESCDGEKVKIRV